MLTMPHHVSQNMNDELTMAVHVYYDKPGNPQLMGMPLLMKGGAYRWMVNPGGLWTYQHVHLGPGSGDLRFATENPSYPGFRVPVQKWLCLAVSIKVDNTAGTTTLRFYLNGQMWGPPNVYNTV